ncbi:SDR family NAD(P)-dependent oxidoreductase [Homoserinibacter sp. YIM 151385]|uniref:SDR family NAD(P)-dependent oxidoreductase n=1 Tax=Homoserinibacter sp. YIM 151385 TaxID=2985506 RepID=UPI0022F03551|nr:SDR family NAD(P)-dependent oxidoreductase [Homoserinibacter sp. YIM 151385]WBU37076.1 SDR family NAD(P)-dependent oxidoreductase [Homoserinibacter sp. YIM 151385]
MSEKPITAKSSIGQWLKHPEGGRILREMLAQAGQTEKALAPAKLFSLERVAGMSNGMLTAEMVADMVARANGGAVPAAGEGDEDDAAAAAIAAPFEERITPGRFAGRTVIVTGAGSGIGRATASRIVREGGRVIGVDVSAERLEALAAEHPGADIVAVVGDITAQDDVDAIVRAAGGRIDGLANIAGITDDMTPLHEVGDAVWQRVFAVNVEGTMRLSRAVLPIMLAAGSGSIVNTSSEAGLRGSAAGVAYTASKHAVIGITKSSAFMYAGSGIRVNAVAPGGVATNIGATFASEFAAERLQGAMANIPSVAEAAQLAASITFLLSDDGTNVTGAVLASDGGWSAV